MASERAAIQTAFDLQYEEVEELTPGNALIVKKDGKISEKQILKPLVKKSCSFERVYFSRGTDKGIYEERKKLGANIVPAVLKSIDNDLEHSVFSFIPNTAEIAFYGMLEELRKALEKSKVKQILQLGDNLSEEDLDTIISKRIRGEKIAVKRR